MNVYVARQAIRQLRSGVPRSGVMLAAPISPGERTSLLKPGGTFFIRDDHPMFMTIGRIFPTAKR